MLLTGFDAPVEQVIYLDAPLKEHTLLQAIARVNRPYGDEKKYGMVVDYCGVSAKLQDALAVFSTTDVQGALTPNVDELPRLESRHAAAMKFFQAVENTNDLDACVRVLEPEDVRAAFDLAFRRFSQSMDMLLPDQRALAYHADLRWLGKIRGTARARYRDDRLDLAGCGEKVRRLIADAVVADGIQILVKEVQLFSPEFEEKVAALGTDDAKASEMEHAIRHEINVRVEENPVFYQSLRTTYFVSPPPAAGRELGPSATKTLPSASTATPSPATPCRTRVSCGCGGMNPVSRSSPAAPIRTPFFQPGWLFTFDSESIAYSTSSGVMNSPLTRL